MAGNVGALPHARTRPIAEVAYSRLYDLIIQGKLLPGQKLTVKGLSEELGISRTPVHDALLRLEADGLVVIEPRKGTYVSRLTRERVASIMDVRRALELLACETAIQRMKSAEIRRLRRINDDMRETVSGDRDPTVSERQHDALNREFHDVIVEASGNEVLLEIYEALKAHVMIARAHTGAPSWRTRVIRECDEHDQIVEGFEKGDLAALRQALTEHLDRSKQSLVRDMW